MQNEKRHTCDRCGKILSSYRSLWRHKKKCQVNDTSPSIGQKRPFLHDGKDIPTFDGAEFSGAKPKSRATIDKMMEMLNVPEHRRDKIATEMLREEKSSSSEGATIESSNSEEKEEEEEQNDIKSLIQSTIKYLTTEDYNELINLLHDIENEAGPDFVNYVVELKRLIDKFLVNKFDPDDGELILPKIMDLCRKLEASPTISLSKQQRIKMLLNDIDENSFRVESILTRLDEADDEEDIANTLEQLKQEELISQEQYQKLMEDDAAFELPAIVTIIKDTKIGRGLNFLPRKLSDLTSKLESLIEEGTVPIKDLLVYLDEIFRQKAITLKKYQSIKKDIEDVKN